MLCSGWMFAAIAVHMVAARNGNPSMENCGVSKVSSLDNKIVGGRNAQPGEFPWQLSLQKLTTSYQYDHICGASVINEKFAITAAHCIETLDRFTYRVLAGTNNLNTRVTLHSIHWVIPYVHEQYDPNHNKNDIALLRLKPPLNIDGSDGFINGVCLPDKELADKVTGMGTVTGWGYTREGGPLSNYLRAVDVSIITDDQCRQEYKDANVMIENTMICAGFEEGGKDACQGDSGGPLIQRNSEGVFNLIGIVSTGIGCAEPNRPGIYTETAYYLDWIRRTTTRLGNTWNFWEHTGWIKWRRRLPYYHSRFITDLVLLQ